MGSPYPTTTPLGRFGRPHRNDMGHGCIIASVQARRDIWDFDTYAHPNVMARPATSRHHGAHATPHPLAQAHAIPERGAWSTPRAAAKP
eukprot:6613469-Prymnesium_polylepis.1